MNVGGWILVGLLGGLAAGARYIVDAEITRVSRIPFPVGIFVVNILGALLVGLVAGGALEGQARVVVAGGVIGSFTTFSTWILDTHELGRIGQARLAWLNLAASAAVGLAAVAIGNSIAG